MEKKINIAEILKDCPEGMELDSVLWDNVTFDRVADNGIWIEHIDSKNRKHKLYLYNNGSFPIHHLGSLSTKCVIFPKGKTSWEEFQNPFKDGDVVFYNDTISIFKEWEDETLFRTYACTYLCAEILDINVPLFGERIKREIRHATELEKEKLFDAIKANGFRWNAKTKNLEELHAPIFKRGQVIKLKGCPDNNMFWHISNIRNYQYICNNGRIIDIDEQHHYELVSSKFNVDSLIPFESKVLVRTENSDVWEGDIFVRYDRNATVNKFHCIGGWYEKCIPFKGNEWLLGNTDDCNDNYKIWEN